MARRLFRKLKRVERNPLFIRPLPIPPTRRRSLELPQRGFHFWTNSTGEIFGSRVRPEMQDPSRFMVDVYQYPKGEPPHSVYFGSLFLEKEPKEVWIGAINRRVEEIGTPKGIVNAKGFGFFKAVIFHAIEIGKKNGMMTVKLYCEGSLIPFCQRFGFHVVESGKRQTIMALRIQ